jgi:hypothetical protein
MIGITATAGAKDPRTQRQGLHIIGGKIGILWGEVAKCTGRDRKKKSD